MALKRAHNKNFGRGMVDLAGRQALATVFGELVVGNHVDDVSVQFQYSNSTNDVIINTTGTGANTNANSMARAAAGDGGVGLSQMTSKDALRYRPGHEAFAQQTARFVGADTGLTHFIGFGNTADRVGFGTKDGVFGAYFIEGGNETFVAQTDFNVDKIDGTKGVSDNASGFNIDITKFNIFMPSYGWLGIAPLTLMVYGGRELGWIVAHAFDFVNEQEEPHLENPSLPLMIETERTSGDGLGFVETSSWRAGVVAGREEDNSSNRRFGSAAVDVDALAGATVGQGNHLLTLKSKPTFQGKNNHVKVKVDFIISTNEVNKTIVIKVFATADIITNNVGFSPVYVDVNADNSVMQDYIAAIQGLDLSGLNELDQGIINANDQRVNPDVLGFNIYAAEEVTFVVIHPGGGAGTVSLQVDWGELF